MTQGRDSEADRAQRFLAKDAPIVFRAADGDPLAKARAAQAELHAQLRRRIK